MKFKMENLDRAAFLVCLGAVVLDVTGSYPRHTFVLEVTKEILHQEKADKRVNYLLFSQKRQWLKKGAGRLNVPVDGTIPKLTPFNWKDIARII